jgi:hypothetical protein
MNMRLVRAELMTVSRSLWWLVLGALLLNVGGVFLAVLLGDAGLSTEDRVRNAYQMAAMGYVFVMLIGVVMYRHRTLPDAFLVEPRRERVVAAKVLAATLIGLAVSVAGAAAAIATAVPLLSAQGLPVTVPGVPAVVLGAVVGTTLYATLGAALGVLLRNALAGVIVVVAWFFYAEYFLVAYVDAAGRWLPGGAAKALSSFTMPGTQLLPPWAGGLVLLGYAVLLGVAAAVLGRRRDLPA